MHPLSVRRWYEWRCSGIRSSPLGVLQPRLQLHRSATRSLRLTAPHHMMGMGMGWAQQLLWLGQRPWRWMHVVSMGVDVSLITSGSSHSMIVERRGVLRVTDSTSNTTATGATAAVVLTVWSYVDSGCSLLGRTGQLASNYTDTHNREGRREQACQCHVASMRGMGMCCVMQCTVRGCVGACVMLREMHVCVAHTSPCCFLILDAIMRLMDMVERGG